MSGKQFCREESKAPGGQDDHKSAKHTRGKKDQQHCQEVNGGNPSPLHSTGEATPGLMYPVLGSSVHDKVSPAKVNKDDEGTEVSFVQGEAESWYCLSWKTEDLGDLTSVHK